MNISTKPKKIKEIDVSTNEAAQNILKQYNISDRKVSKYLYGKELEIKIINDFLEENHIKFSDFVLLLLYRDGAITDELAAASLYFFKKMKDVFTHERAFTFDYKQKYTKIDELNNGDNSYKVLKLRFVMVMQIDAHWAQKGFLNFQQYLKTLLNDIGVYPDGLYAEIEKNLDTSIDRSTKVKKELKEDDSNIYCASFTVSSFEKQKILNPFNDFLHKKGLNISKLVRYKMLDLKLIDFETAKLDHQDRDKIIRLKERKAYKVKNNYKDMKELKKQIEKKSRETVVVLIPDVQELKDKLKGKMGTFVKYSLKDYGVYPTFGGEPYNDSFKLFQNQKKLEDLEELLKKPQES